MTSLLIFQNFEKSMKNSWLNSIYKNGLVLGLTWNVRLFFWKIPSFKIWKIDKSQNYLFNTEIIYIYKIISLLKMKI